MAGRPPVTAAQVGDSFVTQYYHKLVEEPHEVHRFYLPGSVVMHTDGTSTRFRVTIPQIHELFMSLNVTNIEIKTFHSLDSLDGAVLVVASGVVKLGRLRTKRNFSQSFLLAPQESGFFVHNDTLFFLEEHPTPLFPATTGTVGGDSLYLFEPVTKLLQGMHINNATANMNPEGKEVYDSNRSSKTQNLICHPLKGVNSPDRIEDSQQSLKKNYASTITNGYLGTSLIASNLSVVSGRHCAAPSLSKESNMIQHVAPKLLRREALEDNSVAKSEEIRRSRLRSQTWMAFSLDRDHFII